MNDDLLERLDELDGYTAGLRDLLRQIEEELEMIEAWKRSARHAAAAPSASRERLVSEPSVALRAIERALHHLEGLVSEDTDTNRRISRARGALRMVKVSDGPGVDSAPVSGGVGGGPRPVEATAGSEVGSSDQTTVQLRPGADPSFPDVGVGRPVKDLGYSTAPGQEGCDFCTEPLYSFCICEKCAARLEAAEEADSAGADRIRHGGQSVRVFKCPSGHPERGETCGPECEVADDVRAPEPFRALDNWTLDALRKATAEREDAIRHKLIELGWTPPGEVISAGVDGTGEGVASPQPSAGGSSPRPSASDVGEDTGPETTGTAFMVTQEAEMSEKLRAHRVEDAIQDALFYRDPEGRIVFRWSDGRRVFTAREVSTAGSEVRMELEHRGLLASRDSAGKEVENLKSDLRWALGKIRTHDYADLETIKELRRFHRFDADTSQPVEGDE